VYDPLSALVAQTVGYEVAALTGAAASYTTLAAPDINLLTLSEFADQVRRVSRASELILIADADHGFGNALSVMRTVEELEHAGLSALTIEDTALPRRFGQAEGAWEVISIAEMTGKLAAAVAMRADPALVIAAHTSLRTRNLPDTIARVKAYADTGVDALFVVGLERMEQIEAIRAEVHLPIMLGPVAASMLLDELAAQGVRIVFGGHEPLMAAVKALTDTYKSLIRGAGFAKADRRIASAQEMKILARDDTYRRWGQEYLRLQ
jgi:carboxyvinyl-carboxyphosphonate phosphorylmutase